MRCRSMVGLVALVGLVGGLALLLRLASAEAQVTYETGPPLPGAAPPIATGPAPAPSPPATVSVAPPEARPVAPAPATPLVAPDVNNPVKQSGQVVEDLAKGDVKALRRGPLLIHGNYCGVGNRPNTPPTDALDEACMHHDACTTEGKLPSCACNNRLQAEALRISRDPSTPGNVQALAATMAASMSILICK